MVPTAHAKVDPAKVRWMDPDDLPHAAQSSSHHRRRRWIVSSLLPPALLHRQGRKVKFGKPKKVKIQYINASHGGVEAEPINQGRPHVAQFTKPEDVLVVNMPTGNTININLGGDLG